MSVEIFHQNGKIVKLKEHLRNLGNLGSGTQAYELKGEVYLWSHYADHACMFTESDRLVPKSKVPKAVREVLGCPIDQLKESYLQTVRLKEL